MTTRNAHPKAASSSAAAPACSALDTVDSHAPLSAAAARRRHAVSHGPWKIADCLDPACQAAAGNTDSDPTEEDRQL